jgi:uncharacterized protein (TIGR02001 family)
MAASVSIDSQQRFRGFSLSDGHPTASALVSYDDASGFYLNGSISAVERSGGPKLLGYQANAGFARRVSPVLSLDAGLVRSAFDYRYPYPYEGGRWTHYTEAYVGASLRDVTARLSYSPNYYDHGVSTLYAEMEAGFQPAEEWRLSAHVGALTYLDTPAYVDRSARYDWRLAASRQLGRFEVHSTLSGGGPRNSYVYGLGRSGTALTVGASLNL